MEGFKRSNKDGFVYNYERVLKPGEEVIIKTPPISANKRSVNDYGWQTDGDVTLCATLSEKPANAMWQVINERDDINKTVALIKATNNDTENSCRLHIRAILC